MTTIVEILLDKLVRASRDTGIRDIAIAGGVSANSGLRNAVAEQGRRRARRAVEVAQKMPLDRMVIETDCPYMAPEPHRGVRNDSGFVRYMAQKLAELRGVSLEEMAAITMENGRRLFAIGETP